MKTLLLIASLNFNPDTICMDTIYIDRPELVQLFKEFWKRNPIDTLKTPVITINRKQWIRSYSQFSSLTK